jgi:hypothetical protein
MAMASSHYLAHAAAVVTTQNTVTRPTRLLVPLFGSSSARAERLGVQGSWPGPGRCAPSEQSLSGCFEQGLAQHTAWCAASPQSTTH